MGTISPAFFCMLSDILMPYVGGKILGVKMHLHICFVNEFSNIGLFLLIGLVTGLVLRFHVDEKHGGSFFTRGVTFYSHVAEYYGFNVLFGFVRIYFLVSPNGSCIYSVNFSGGSNHVRFQIW